MEERGRGGGAKISQVTESKYSHLYTHLPYYLMYNLLSMVRIEGKYLHLCRYLSQVLLSKGCVVVPATLSGTYGRRLVQINQCLICHHKDSDLQTTP